MDPYKFKPVEASLSEGQKIRIREVEIIDTLPLIKCIRTYLINGFIPVTVEEYDMQIEKYILWIDTIKKHSHDLLIVAEYKDQIIGNLDLQTLKRKMLSHNMELGMGVHPAWQKIGVGGKLLAAGMNYAFSHPRILNVIIQVFATNTQAIHLYKKAGFQQDGIQKNYIQLPNGKYVDNILMSQMVGDVASAGS